MFDMKGDYAFDLLKNTCFELKKNILVFKKYSKKKFKFESLNVIEIEIIYYSFDNDENSEALILNTNQNISLSY
jgi:hypothetical protein